MNPLLQKNYSAGAAIAAYRFVKPGADDFHVIQAAAATDGIIGVTGKIAVAAAEDRTDIITHGIADVELGGSVTRGALLTADTVGRGITASSGDNRVAGVALYSGVSGDIIPLLLSQSGQVTHSATLTATVTITTAQLLALNTTPIPLVGAPGANKANILVGATLFLDFATTAYDGIAAGEDLNIRYTDGSGQLAATIEATGFLDAVADAVRYVYPASTAAITPVANAAVVLYMATGNIATGDSPLKVKIDYKVVDTAW